jgi:hypothetical protein
MLNSFLVVNTAEAHDVQLVDRVKPIRRSNLTEMLDHEEAARVEGYAGVCRTAGN